MGDKIWLKRVLIPIWVIQLIILLIEVAGSAISLYAVDSYSDGNIVYEGFNIAAAVAIAVCASTIIVDIVEIVMVARHSLRPVANIVIQSIKSSVWTVWFVFTIIGFVDISELGHSSYGVGLLPIIILWLACLAQLIYGAVIVHRHRKGTLYRGQYQRAEDGMGYSTAYHPNEVPPKGSYAAYNPNPAPASYVGQPPPFQPSGASTEYYGGRAGQQGYEMHMGTGR